MELQDRLDDIRRQGLGVAAISYDSPEVLRDFAARRGITFPLLSDPDSKVIKTFGILNTEIPAGTPFAGVPYPGTYIVDVAGRVVAKYFEENYTERFTASDILVKQYGAAAGAVRNTTETRHLQLNSAASTSRVRPGQRIALTLDIRLNPGMHVYGPGVEGGYIAVNWQIEPNPLVVAHQVTAPKPRLLRLEAVDETVPVYQGAFRLVRDVTVAQSAKPGELIIDGTFRYQACDDRMCYVPQTVPVKWTLNVEKLDTERPPKEIRKRF